MMRLTESLCTAEVVSEEGNARSWILNLEAGHPILQGHFPGNPVVPGVCILQIIRELLEDVVAQKLLMREAPQAKFLAMWTPTHHPKVTLELHPERQETGWQVQARLYADSLTFLKFQGFFEPWQSSNAHA